MKKILLACSAGMSTSILEKNMKDYIKEAGLKFEVLAMDSESAKGKIGEYDVILLGPQVRYMESSFKAISGGKPVGVIPVQTYGLMKGKETVELAQQLMEGK